jgi:MFS superfamily sulfate permease-like transporter
MGIAIASGLPPAKGLITGIVGGLIVGFFAGSKLQVSGPAAGLAVLVFELVRQHGVGMLGPILLLAGFLQLLAGRFRLGCWFRVTAPAVVYGMLAGIGVLIVLSQVHVMLDAAPKPSGLDNLTAFPGAVAQALPSFGWQAGLLGLSTIAVMWLWEKFRPHGLRFIPGALLGVGLATVASLVLALQVKRVEVPDNLAEAIDWLRPADLLNLADPTLLIAAFAVAFIASAETLLSAAAVDRMHSGERADFDRELSAQGIGNMLCGLLGALPMTGVIVRSSANVQAGAQTRLSTILHGLWILAFVALLPGVLRQIPSAALAGVLVVTGWRLVSLQHARHLFERHGLLPTVIWAATFVTVVATDLLTGVLVGLALTLVELVPNLRKLRLRIKAHDVSPDERELSLEGAATFVQLPKIAKALEAAPAGGMVRLNLERLSSLDHTCAEILTEWLRGRQSNGGRVEVRAHEPVRQRLALAGEH